MALPQILIDSSFLYGVLDRSNPKHALAKSAISSVPSRYIIPDITLTETAFLFHRAGGVPAVVAFLDAIVAARWTFEPVIRADIMRAREVMSDYATAKLDFVDCCIVAIAERLDIDTICTFDRRDFGIIRPRHREHFIILP